jgi:uracil-DNA glycosylase
MPHASDPGYVHPPFDTLCSDYPGAEVYPADDFRIEWGPIFHRGRLDGSARVLVIGQDPSSHECVARRILVGEAGQRVQGFLARLGIESSYAMINAFLYPVYGQGGANRNVDDPAIAAYRNRWLDALLDVSSIEAVVAFGRLADSAWQQWKETPAGAANNVAYQALRHPTYPESSSRGNRQKFAEAMQAMLAQWNDGLRQLAPAIQHPDVARDLVPYSETLELDDLSPIPEQDLPPGMPAWMRSIEAWAVREGETTETKRATLVITVPKKHRPWTPIEP